MLLWWFGYCGSCLEGWGYVVVHVGVAALISRLEEHAEFLYDVPDRVELLRDRVKAASEGSSNMWLVGSSTRLAQVDDALSNALSVVQSVVEKHRAGMMYE